MTQETYHSYGVRFRYPSQWELTEHRQDDELSITVASPETSFWSLTLLPDGPSPDEIMASAVVAFEDEYEEIDIYKCEASICDRRSVARDVEFVCLELVNSAFLRAVRLGERSALVLYQGTDHELEETRETLEEISSSLHFEEDESLFH